MAIVDPAGIFLHVNEAFAALFGNSQDGILKQKFANLFLPEDVHIYQDWASGTMLGGGAPLCRDIRFLNSDEDVIWCRLCAQACFDGHGHFRHFAIQLSDISQQVRDARKIQEACQEAEDSNRAKTHFLSNISHELRTPLNGIVGFSQLLERNIEENLSKQQLKQIGLIIESGQHVLSLVNEILDLSRVETGKQDFDIQTINLNETIERVVNTMQAEAELSHITLVKDLPKSACFALGDERRVSQIVLNLLSNAIKYNCDQGEVTIRCIPAFRGFCRFEISDQGRGISDDDRDKVFVAFERLVEGAPVIEGAGIGLAVCKSFVEAMNGQIGFESREGMGTTFWVELPVATQPSDAQSSAQDDSQAMPDLTETLSGASGKIIYIEDNRANRMMIEQFFLDDPTLTLHTAKTGREGIEKLQDVNPDLVLLDIRLPDMSGYEILEELRRDEKFKGLPVIAVSADAMMHDQLRAKDAGFDHYLTKPVDFGLLREMVARYIN